MRAQNYSFCNQQQLFVQIITGGTLYNQALIQVIRFTRICPELRDNSTVSNKHWSWLTNHLIIYALASIS